MPEKDENERTVYTTREVRENPERVLAEVNASGEQAFITHFGRFVGMITPLMGVDVEGAAVAELVKDDGGNPDALDLAPIRARLTAASEGPWRTHDTHLDWGGYTHTVLGPERREPGSRPGWDRIATEGIAWCPTFEGASMPTKQNARANAAFIAGARTDVALLLDEVDRLRAALGPDLPYHVIELREDGWTIMHRIACRPNLFDCPYNQAALTDPLAGRMEHGRYRVDLADGHLKIGEPA